MRPTRTIVVQVIQRLLTGRILDPKLTPNPTFHFPTSATFSHVLFVGHNASVMTYASAARVVFGRVAIFWMVRSGKAHYG
jgi:hypothetical protein